MHRWVVWGAAVIGAGCIGDKAAGLSVPETLAVGAYAAVGFGDVCKGSKADLCSSESVEQVESIAVDPPGTLEIVPVDEAPADLRQATGYPGPYVAHGLTAGTSKVCMQGLFSDGTHRRDCVFVRVDRIAHVTVDYACGYSVMNVPAQPLVPGGTLLQFRIGFQAADGTALAGDILHPVDDGAFMGNGPAGYAWASPLAGGSVTFGSPLDPAFSQRIATYTAADVTAVVGEVTFPPPIVIARGQALNVQLSQDAGTERTCVPGVTRIQTETPDICLGPDGETVWMEAAGVNESWFTAVAEGTCRLSLGAGDGDAPLGSLEVPFQLRPM